MMVETMENRTNLSVYLGRRVYVEAFGRKRYGVVASVYRDGKGDTVCEVEFTDGGFSAPSFPKLKFVGDETA